MTEPTDAERLALAEAAFTRGDFAAVRHEADLLLRSLDPETRKQSKALRARVSVDPAAVAIWLASAVFFVAVCLRYLGR